MFKGDKNGQFDDDTAQFGLLQPTFGNTGFGAQWFDYDNDGRLDLFIANGGVTLGQLEGTGWSRYAAAQSVVPQRRARQNPSETFLTGRPCSFRPPKSAAALRSATSIMTAPSISLSPTITDRYACCKIRLGVRNHWLIVKLESPENNRFAVGAQVALIRNGQDTLWRSVRADSSYLSANDLRVHFGCGADPRIDALLVYWPDGSRERFANIKADRIIAIRQGTGERIKAP